MFLWHGAPWRTFTFVANAFALSIATLSIHALPDPLATAAGWKY